MHKDILFMDPPIIPRYSKDELVAMTQTHRFFSLGLLIYCIAGFVAMVIWGIHSFKNFIYWYRTEIGRCIIVWIFVIALEMLFVFLFCKKDRGYLWDLYCREICVTDELPIEIIYGKTILFHIDKKILHDKISGVELEVTEGTQNGEVFLLYREISKYWNCFPTNVSYPIRYRGPRFEPGEQKLRIVRLYYLKHSKIVVDMDVVEAKS